MKKMICGLLALMLLLPIIPHLGNAAAKGKISLSSKTEKFQRGLAFEVDVELNRNPGISSLRAILEFDEKVLEILKVVFMDIPILKRQKSFMLFASKLQSTKNEWVAIREMES